MNEKEQKTVKVRLPKLYDKRIELDYDEDAGFQAKYAYDHFDGHMDCDYSFLMRGNLVEKVARSQNVNTFVLPSFQGKAIYMILNGCFAGLKDVTLIVTGNQPIKICGFAFDKNADVKLILPKDMALFHIRQKCETKDSVLTIDFPMIAKRNLKLSHYLFGVTQVDEIDNDKVPFKIRVDKTHFYDRVSHTVEEVKTNLAEKENDKHTL